MTQPVDEPVRHRAVNGVAIAAIVAAILLVLFRIRYGFGPVLQDEGFHLTAPLRLALGDRPFRDEALSVLRAFDVVLAPLFLLAPHGGVIFWRVIGFIIQLAVALSVLLILRRMASPYVAVGCVVAIILFAPYNLWAPWYGNLAAAMLAISACMWLGATRGGSDRTALALSGAGGLVFSLLLLNYTPLVALGVIPLAGLAIRPPAHVRQRWTLATAAWLAGAILGAVVIVGGLWASGLLRWVLVSIAELRSVSVYSGNLAQIAFRRFLQSGYPEQALLVSFAFLAAGAFAAERRTRAQRVVFGLAAVGFGCLVAAFAIDVALHPRPLIDQKFLTLTNLGLGGFGLGCLATRWRVLAIDPWGPHAVALLLFGIGTAIILFVISAAGLHALNGAAWILWPGVFACLERSAAPPRSAASRQPRAIRLMVAALVIVCIANLLLWSYDDKPFWQLPARFTSGKLRGVVTTEERVRDYTQIVDGIRSRTRPGDFILAYDDLAWVYFLTDTRPAVRSSLVTTGRMSEETERLWLDDMRRRGRTPSLVVTQHPLEGESPFVQFIRGNYRKASRSGTMEIWEASANP